MTRKQRRLTLIGIGGAVLTVAVGLVLTAMSDAIVFFHSPTEVVEGKLTAGKRIRVGGLVEPGSVQRGADLRIGFKVTDGKSTVPVSYQGIVAEGMLDANGSLKADTVLAKHDERYMPREVVDALKKAGRWQEGEVKTQ